MEDTSPLPDAPPESAGYPRAWELDEYGEVVSNSYTADRAWEFRYDGSPRARYLAVEYDLTGQGVDPDSPGTWERDGALHWTDYLGDIPWGDLDVDDGGTGNWANADEVMRYLGLAAQQTADGSADEQYYHEDLIGSTMLTTDDSANDVSTATYTAFGEILDGSGAPGGDAPSGFPRYQYAGRYGYESGILSLAGVNTDLPSITLQHLGARWYQPDIGRFVQRDPIGISGGLNVYAYCNNGPAFRADPSGEGFWDGENWFHDWVARKVWMRIHSQKTLAEMSDTRATAEAISGSVVLGAGGYFAAKYAAYYCIRLAGRDIKCAVHGPHHPFGRLGKLPHLQWNWWQPGVRGSGGVIRIPLPPGGGVLGTPIF